MTVKELIDTRVMRVMGTNGAVQGGPGPRGPKGQKGHRGDPGLTGDKIVLTTEQKISLHKKQLREEIEILQKDTSWRLNYFKIKKLKNKIINHHDHFPEYYL